jgi:translation initiation factor 5
LFSLDVTKYFGAEVGALTNWDEKEGRYIVNGVHDADKLQTLLDGFIKKFVLCPKCDNPETVLSVKNGIIFRTCKACGAKNPCDNLHKLATYIKTNPPPKPVKLKQAKDTAAANIQAGSGTVEEQVDGMVAPEGFDDVMNQTIADVDEDDWDEDAAQANREAELAGLSERVKKSLAIKNEGIDEDFKDPLDAFADIVEGRAEWTAEALLDEIEERNIRSDKAIAVVTQILLADEPLKKLTGCNTALFAGILRCDKTKLAFLGSLERVLVLSGKTKQISALLQAAYMADIIDDEILEEWKEKPSKKFVTKEESISIRKEATPFFAWLKEESDEESDEGESG